MSETTSGAAVELLLALALRGCFFALASRYLKQTLFSDLRQVIHDEISLNTQASGSNGIASGTQSGYQSPDEYPTSSASSPNGYSSLRDQLYNLRGASASSASVLPTNSNHHTSAGQRRSSGSNAANSKRLATGNNKKSGQNQGLAPKISGIVFCLSVSECSALFAIIMFGGIMGPK